MTRPASFLLSQKRLGIPVNYGGSGGAPAQTWQIAKGMTLKEGVMAWAIKAPCLGPGVKNWTVYWQTPVHYQIEAPLHFRGDFKSALRSVLELYQSARKPLYAQIHSAQCLIRITDKPLRE
ncbi:hypothetical protein CJJ18_11660 (plasmid) [Candidatus Williamhamiltonella defendens]|uniref:Toxin co-regulated pilus biosynthesis protein Q C-terminal domain-containing protein n=1 Tax=Candidatus Williamhamiltonella defendens TaxID=138072 RepID=A0AAC9VKF8_9ENTR|nr:toxin co-regulated pilus biosynthesis Q family protein [Candidatus Hamiltonella defensa]ASV34613.1 hypothetical protein CJJ18_11660 [Candidatus Hamiltonella defensa]AWK17575.1 hypothetical protein CCS40_11475 [Candidatus Hamiltonella defensa]